MIWLYANRERAVLLAVLILVSIGLYINTLSSEFVSDDILAILNNKWLRDVRYIPQFFIRSLWSFSPSEVYSNYYRPFENLFFMIGHIISGQNSWGNHVVNIVFHTTNGVIIFFISTVLIEGSRGANSGVAEQQSAQGTHRVTSLLSFLAAILFVTNPINTESVAWASAVSELSFAFFFFLALYLFMRGRGYLSALFFLFSLFSKETGLVLIFFIVAFDLVIRRERIFPLKAWVVRYWPFAVAVLVYTALRYNAIGGIVPYEPAERSLTQFQYLLNIFPLTAEFIKNLVYPFNLIFFHYARLDYIYSFFEIWNIIYIVLFLVWLYILKLLWRREPAIVYSLLWIVLPLIPIYYLGWNQGEPTYADRFLYTPSAGLAIAVTLGIRAILTNRVLKARERSASIVIGVVFFIVVLCFSIATVKRNVIWQGGLTLWQDTARKSPQNVEARLSYAKQLALVSRFEEALTEYRIIVRGLPQSAVAHNGLGIVYAGLGFNKDALGEFRLAVKLDPDFEIARINLKRAERLVKTRQSR